MRAIVISQNPTEEREVWCGSGPWESMGEV